MDADILDLLAAENEHIRRLQAIVRATIEDEALITQNLLNPPREVLTRGQRLSDRIARFGGSWTFIVAFFLVLAAWIAYNAAAPTGDRFDPYPFILMNLVLSCLAALQAPIIMMSQNRQEEKDRKRGENDYLVNLKAELEIRSLDQKLDLLTQEQIRVLFESQTRQLEILKRIEARLDAGVGK